MMTISPSTIRRTVRPGGVWSGVLVWAGRLSVAVLVVFHAWLFWTQATDGKLFDADVALRWGLAGVLGVAFWSLHRLGLPLFRGRRAVVLWLLVILIHCHAVWTGDAGQVIPVTMPQAAVEFLPAGLQLVSALSAVLLLAWLAARAGAASLRPWRAAPVARPYGLPSAVATLRFSPRPPPLN